MQGCSVFEQQDGMYYFRLCVSRSALLIPWMHYAIVLWWPDWYGGCSVAVTVAAFLCKLTILYLT